jgi:hypothetical protein
MNEPLIIDAGGKPTAMYHRGKLWLSLTRIQKTLDGLTYALLFSGETCPLDKRDGGVYVPFDDVANLIPALKEHWDDTRKRYMEAVKWGT